MEEQPGSRHTSTAPDNILSMLPHQQIRAIKALDLKTPPAGRFTGAALPTCGHAFLISEGFAAQMEETPGLLIIQEMLPTPLTGLCSIQPTELYLPPLPTYMICIRAHVLLMLSLMLQ